MESHGMQRQVARWVGAVEQAWQAGAVTWEGEHLLVERIGGGMNNALFRVADGEVTVACKVCVRDARERAAREYATLSALQGAGVDLAPKPLGLVAEPLGLPGPVVVYHWLAGAPLPSQPNAAQLAALLDSFHCLHAIHPEAPEMQGVTLRDAWLHWFDWQPYVEELRDFQKQYGPWLGGLHSEGEALAERLNGLIARCAELIEATTVAACREAIAVRLCRVDPNLANSLLDGSGGLRWVDWEYSGWGDPAMELAELRWHASLTGLPAAHHDWLRSHYRRPNGDWGFEARLLMWDRLLTTRWAWLLVRSFWTTQHGLDRVRLTVAPTDPDEIWQRLLAFTARAESCWDG